jgi:uncharacterized protein (DUF1330 family)
MPAYVIGDIRVLDEEAYASYLEVGPQSVAQYGGRFLSRAAATEQLEGEWPHNRIVLVEFPSMERAREWYASPEFQAAKERRAGAADVKYLLIGDR